MIETSAEINEIAAACAKVQAELENVGKGGTNPHFKSKYATLPDVLDAVRDKYAAAGVAIWQCPVNGEGPNIGVVTRFAHSSGQWIQSTLYVAPGRFDAQGAGSVITYLRRYALMAMAGVSAEDDDGSAAVAQPAPRRPGTSERERQWAGDPLKGVTVATEPSMLHNGQDASTETDVAALGAARDRIIADLGAARTPIAIRNVIAGSSVDLALIKQAGPKTYDRIMEFATACENELLSGA